MTARADPPASRVELAYVSVGCNRGVHVADWNREVGPGGGLLAFGAHDTVAVYDPVGARIVRTLRGGHTDRVTAVRWLECDARPGRWLISAGADGAVFLWHRDDDPSADLGAAPASAVDPAAHSWRVVARGAHEGPVTDVRALRLRSDTRHARGAPPDARLIVTVAQDCRVRLWRADLRPPAGACPDPDSNPAGGPSLRPAADGPSLRPGGSLPSLSSPRRSPPRRRTSRGRTAWCSPWDAPTARCARTCATWRRYCARRPRGRDDAARARLSRARGTPDWVRDVAFAESRARRRRGERLFVVGDGVARIRRRECGAWRLTRRRRRRKRFRRLPDWRRRALLRRGSWAGGGSRRDATRGAPAGSRGLGVIRVVAPSRGSERTPRAAHREHGPLVDSLATLGHRRRRIAGSANRDGTGGEDVWMAVASMGEAAASCLGFYGASFDAAGDDIIANGHGGALHRWRQEGVGGDWVPAAGVFRPRRRRLVPLLGRRRSIPPHRFWRSHPTRLHASWDAEGAVASGWRQIARPQVHGHAVTCVAATPSARADRADAGSTRSAARTKTLRVFDAPGTFLGTLARSLSRADADADAVAALEAAAAEAGDDAAGAELPQLGLSNKAIRTADGDAPIGTRPRLPTTTSSVASRPRRCPPPRWRRFSRRRRSGPSLGNCTATETTWRAWRRILWERDRVPRAVRRNPPPPRFGCGTARRTGDRSEGFPARPSPSSRFDSRKTDGASRGATSSSRRRETDTWRCTRPPRDARRNVGRGMDTHRARQGARQGDIRRVVGTRRRAYLRHRREG